MKTGSYREILQAGMLLSTLGFALMAGIFDENTGVAAQVIIQIIAGLGLGATQQTSLLALQASMPYVQCQNRAHAADSRTSA